MVITYVIEIIRFLITRQIFELYTTLVVLFSKRKHTKSIQITNRRNTSMSQAKTFTDQEIEKVLQHISQNKFALRNKVMFLTGLWSGMRVKEIASLRVCDCVGNDGKVKTEIRLSAEQTKGNHPRTVFIPAKLQSLLQQYVDLRNPKDKSESLFITINRRPFNANTMTQHFFWLFRSCGVEGASSHSMRRTFLTRLAGKGIQIRVLAALAGHRAIAVTMRYLDASDDMKRNAVELI